MLSAENTLSGAAGPKEEVAMRHYHCNHVSEVRTNFPFYVHVITFLLSSFILIIRTKELKRFLLFRSAVLTIQNRFRVRCAKKELDMLREQARSLAAVS